MPRRRRFRPNYPLWLAVLLFVGVVAAYIGLGVLFSWLAPRRPGMPSTLYLAFLARCLDATLAVWFFAVGASIDLNHCPRGHRSPSVVPNPVCHQATSRLLARRNR